MRSQDPLIGILILGGLSSVIAMEFTPDHAQAVAEIDGLGLLTASSCQVEKPVLAHHIVGYTYSYVSSDWAADISLAASYGLDGFFLNMGADSWQPARISDAFAAAEAYNAKHPTTNGSAPAFRLALSLDMSSFSCANSADVSNLRTIATLHSSSSAYLKICTSTTSSALPVLSTFSGQYCGFGQAGWKSVTSGFWFAPAFFDMSTGWTGWSGVQASVNWNGAWPQGDTNISFSNDQTWMAETKGKGYVAAVSPWFYTHYGPDTYNKNWVYLSDYWLWVTRWEELIQNRAKLAMVEVVTWNDYSESHYIGPIKGSLPLNSQEWITGYDHQGWLKMLPYYIQAFKNGSYPAIPKDTFYLWARLYDKNAQATGDSVPRPAGADWTNNTLWALINIAPSSTGLNASVTLTCGASSHTTSNLATGSHKLSLPLVSTCNVSAHVARKDPKKGTTVTSTTFTPSGMQYSTKGPRYWNFNAFVAASH